MSRPLSKREQAIRSAFVDYFRSEGCSCCRDTEPHEEALDRLGELLQAPRYDDGSGYNFYALEAAPQRGSES